MREPIKRINEARLLSIEVFFNLLASTIERLVKINSKYNSLDQQRVIDKLVLNHLEFLASNAEDIETILRTPDGAGTTGIDVTKYILTEDVEISDEAPEGIKRIRRNGIQMFISEIGDLYDRAVRMQDYNDAEQKDEFDHIVISRLRLILTNLGVIKGIFEQHPDASYDEVMSLYNASIKPSDIPYK